MHIAPHDNRNMPIIGRITRACHWSGSTSCGCGGGETHELQVPRYETCVVPATGTWMLQSWPAVRRHRQTHPQRLGRGTGGGLCATGAAAMVTCVSEAAEVFVAGARFDEVLTPFAVRADEIDMVQYGSDDTKTHRKIKHILGTKYHGRVGRLLVSELYNRGAGGGRVPEPQT